MNLNLSLLSQAKGYLSPFQDQLVNDVITLSKLVNGTHINDYSFIMAPLAKAYEGFLKDFFLKIGLIDQKQYQSDRFRVGKVLNPSLRYKKFSVFQKLADISLDGEELAELLWDAWKYGRNRVFHYFPGETKNIDVKKAEKTMGTVVKAIIMAGKFLENSQNHKY
jgi:hypothetical protein